MSLVPEASTAQEATVPQEPTIAVEPSIVPTSRVVPEPSVVPDAEGPELIPARMLNEFAYCPRLAYLEWVQQEFVDNLETLEGTFAHRNVDRPTRAALATPPEIEGDASVETDGPHRANGGNIASRSSESHGADDASSTSRNAAASRATGGSESTATTNSSAAADDDGTPRPQSHLAKEVPPERIHARSLMLSAPGEGLVAKLDLIEVDGPVATPVDYKRGTVPDVPEGAWEPERVQLCAQGLILREAGFRCDQGVIWYVGSRRRVTIPFDEALVARTRELVRELRAVSAAGVLPPPLVDSPKCPRCALVGICLPDETNLLTDVDEQPATVRRLLPARDDALPFYVLEQGASLGKDGDRLVVRRKTETIAKVKLVDVSQVSLFGNVQVSAQALREIAARGIPVCHFSYGGWFHAQTSGHLRRNVELRIRQFAVAADPARSLELARAFVLGKIRNCRTLLRRHLPDERRPELDSLADLAAKVERTESVESLLGLEGMAAKVYFAGFAKLLKGGEAFDIEGRNRRPPKDPVNALLSFVYALLAKELTIVLHAVSFDPHLGFYHRPRYGRPSLALDLAEEFRPIVADSTVLTLVNNGEVQASGFVRRAGAVALTEAARRAVIAAFERRLDAEIVHPLFGYRASYRRILEVQARLLARTLLGELPAYPSFLVR